jgi:hypothetical protein
VKKRVARWMFGLYRPSTRERYREDFNLLIDDLVDSGEARWHICLEVALAGCRDRVGGLRPARVVVPTGMLLLATVLVLTTWVGPSAPRASTGSNTIASVSPLLHPVDIPAASQADASRCPDPPPLSAQLPLGAVISSPELKRKVIASVTVFDTTYIGNGRCDYTIRYSP